MRIERMEVKGFGALRDVELDLTPQAPGALLYGRNEAGKSTMMQFIRAILFGFAPRSQLPERYEPAAGGVHGGALLLRLADGSTARVQRYDAPGIGGKRVSSGTLTVTLDNGESGGEELLRTIIGDMTPDVFRNIFAFGLTELQEIRTLQSDDVSSYLFSAGFGVNGSAILEAEKRSASEMEQLFRPRGKKQALNVLTEQLEALEARIRQSRGTVAMYNDMQVELGKLDERIAAVRISLRETEEQLLWHETCLKAQEPWQQLRAAELELAELPAVESFPEDALRRYEEEKLRLDELRSLYDQQTERLSRLMEEIDERRPDTARLDRLRHIDSLHEQLPLIASLHEERKAGLQELARMQEQIHAQISRIDAEWTEEDVARLNASLAERADIHAYRDRLQVLERKSGLLDDEVVRLRDELQRQEKRKRELAGQAAEAQDELRSHYASGLIELPPDERRKRLQRLNRAVDGWRKAELEAAFVKRREEEDRKRGTLFLRLLLMFAGLSVILPVVLFLVDYPIPGIAAAVTMAVMAVALFVLYRKQSGGTKKASAYAKREWQRGAEEVRELIGELSGEDGLAAVGMEGEVGGRSEGDSIGPDAAAAWIEQLELACERLQSDEAVRRRLQDHLAEAERHIAELKERMQAGDEQRAMLGQQLDEALGEWRKWLAERRLPPGLQPETAGELFTLAEQARQLIRNRDMIKSRIADYDKRIGEYERQAEELCGDLSVPYDAGRSVEQSVSRLKELVTLDLNIEEQRRALRQQYAERQEEQAALKDRIRLAEERIGALWQEAGAADEAEFRMRAAACERSRELQQTIKRSLSQLEWLVTPDRMDKLRLTMEHAGGAELAAKLEEVQARLVALRAERDALHDRRIKLDDEIERLKEGAEHADLLQRKEELLAELKRHASRYTMLALAGGLLKRTRELYERERQPKVLRKASEYMSVITGGDYTRILAPFGEQRLIVERKDGQQLDTAYLSRGTAEQLYLAMRFALAEAYSAEHSAPPLVLDDIFVNFDEERAVRCLDVIRRVSERHQVLMFTCHDYMRRLIERQLPDMRIIPLPGRSG